MGTTNISSYDYGVNSIGQRTDVAKTGSAFAGVRDITWGYNSKGEVVKADHTIPGLDRSYLFDGIGNRLKSADSLTLPTSNNYTPNALNQYTAVDSITPGYDDDGNATVYPLPANVNSTLVWDGENRLISATVNGATTNYRYDAQSRCIATVTSAGAATLVIYDDWNPIAEYSSPNLQSPITHVRSFTWGIDLSVSMQGAGGVGGLLMVTVGSAGSADRYFPTFDGNGNVSEYLDSAGVVQAHYEYDPFGRTTVVTGPIANDFAHRFSTKPLDAATGLYYYGYRWYDPVTGRWPSRDPIEEEGGLNLYAFAENNGISNYDFLGLDCIVLGSRQVSVSPWNHYALEKVTGCCPSVGTEKEFSDWIDESQDNDYDEKVELLNTTGFTAEKYGRHRNVGGGRGPMFSTRWKRVSLSGLFGVSAIAYDNTAEQSSKFVVLFNGDESEVDTKWNEVLSNAGSYQYAEHGSWAGRPTAAMIRTPNNFPDSLYYAAGDNSNAFARFVAAESGLPNHEVSGSHPPTGRSSPARDIDYQNYRDAQIGW